MEKIRNKMRIYLILILIFSVAIIATSVTGFILISKNEILSTVLILTAVVILFFTLKFNTEFEINRHQYIHLSMLKYKDNSILKNSNLLNSKHHDYLIKLLNYKTKASGDDYTLYYKIDDGINTKRRNKTLYAFIIFKKDIMFEDRELSDIFENLERSLAKGESFYNRIFFQMKLTNSKFTTDDIKNADRIFFIKHRRNSVVVLNVLHNPINHEIYYLRSKSYKPVFYLDYAINKLEKILEN